MKFTVKCLENDIEYTEKNFDELYDLYVDDEIEDDAVELETVTAELSDNDYQDSDVCSMEDIASVSDMQELIDTLDEIENMNTYDSKKLEAICEYVGLNGGHNLIDCYENMDDYDFYEDMSLADLAEELCSEGALGDAVQEVYNDNYNYLDMDAIAYDLQFDYTEVSQGIIRS